MGTYENSQKVVNSEFNRDPLLNVAETSVKTKFGRNLKKIAYVTSLVAIGFLFNGCVAGYVASEPEYVQYERPQRPDNFSVWIEGDWSWHSQSHQYYQQSGHWDKPRQGQTYKAGYWETTPKGKSWTKGQWHSDNHQKDNSKNGHNHK